MLHQIARTGSRDSIESSDSFLDEFEVIEDEEGHRPGLGSRPVAPQRITTPFLPFAARQQATPTRASTNSYRAFRAASRQATPRANPAPPSSITAGSPLLPIMRPSASGQRSDPTPRAYLPSPSPAALLQTFARQLDQDLGRRPTDQHGGGPSLDAGHRKGVPPLPINPVVSPQEGESSAPLLLFVPSPRPDAPTPAPALPAGSASNARAPDQTPLDALSVPLLGQMSREGESGVTWTLAGGCAPQEGRPQSLGEGELSGLLGRMSSEAESGGSSPLAPLYPGEASPLSLTPRESDAESTESATPTDGPGRLAYARATPHLLARAPVATPPPVRTTDKEPYTLVQRPGLSLRGTMSPPHNPSSNPLHLYLKQGQQSGLQGMDSAGLLARDGLRQRDFQSELLERVLADDGGFPFVQPGPAKPMPAEPAPPIRLPPRPRDPCFGFSTRRILLMIAAMAFGGILMLFSYTRRQHGTWAFHGPLSASFFESHGDFAELHHHSVIPPNLLHHDTMPLATESRPDDPHPHPEHDQHVDHDRERERELDYLADRDHEHASNLPHDHDIIHDHDYERERGAALAPHLPDDFPHHHVAGKAGLRLLLHIRPHVAGWPADWEVVLPKGMRTHTFRVRHAGPWLIP